MFSGDSMRLTGDALAGLALRPFNRPQMAFHQIERCVQACQYLPVQGRLRAVIGISVQRGDYFFLAHYTCPAFTDMAPSHLQQCLRVAAHLVGSPV